MKKINLLQHAQKYNQNNHRDQQKVEVNKNTANHSPSLLPAACRLTSAYINYEYHHPYPCDQSINNHCVCTINKNITNNNKQPYKPSQNVFFNITMKFTHFHFLNWYMAPNRDIPVLQVYGGLQNSWITWTAPEIPCPLPWDVCLWRKATSGQGSEQSFHSGLLHARQQ